MTLNKLRLGIISQKKYESVVKCWNLGIGEKSLLIVDFSLV